MLNELSIITVIILSGGFASIIGFVLWTRLRPIRILYIIAFLLPFQLYINIGPVPLASGYLLVATFVLFTLLKVISYDSKIFLPRLMVPISLFLVSIFLSFFKAIDRPNLIIKASQILLYIVFYWAVAHNVDEMDVVNKLSRIVLVGGTISALIGIGQFMIASFISADFVTDLFYNKLGMFIFGIRGIQRIGSSEATGFFYRSSLPGFGNAFRAFGLFGGGNSFGFYHALLYAFSLTQGKELFKKYSFFVTVTLAAAAFLSWSRMAWLMMFFATVYQFVRCKLHISFSLVKLSHVVYFVLLVVLAGVVLVLMMQMFPDFPLSAAILATVSRSDASTISRLKSMQIGWNLFKQHPFIGIGLGNYAAVFGQKIGTASNITAESLYIEMLVEIGIVGLFSFVLILMRVGRIAYRLHFFPETSGFSGAFYNLWLAAIVGFVFNAVITEPRTMLMWWLMIGLLTACKRAARRSTKQSAEFSTAFHPSVSACVRS
jgi:O-antigen ligase